MAKRFPSRDGEITYYDPTELGITAFDGDAASQTGTMSAGTFIDCAGAEAIACVLAKTGSGTSSAQLAASIQFFDDQGVAASEKISLFTAATIGTTDPFKLIAGIGPGGLFTSLGTLGASLISGSAYNGLLSFPKCKIELTTGTAGSGTVNIALHVYVKR
jgi:hypothetical protein